RDKAQNKVRFWDTETGQPIGQPLELSFAVTDADFSPDGKLLVTAGVLSGKDNPKGSPGFLQVFETATGKPLPIEQLPGEVPLPIEQLPGEVYRVAFGPDGKTILARYSSGHHFQMFRFRPQDNALRRVGSPIKGSFRSFPGFAFSPDGNAVLL